MPACRHHWEMSDVHFGFVAFERCSHCRELRTRYSAEGFPDHWDEYREGACLWRRVETAQSLRFDLRCTHCGERVDCSELMGLLFCTGCRESCHVDRLRRRYEDERTQVLVAFGFLPMRRPFPARKVTILTDYFNQRRDPSRWRVQLLPCELVDDFSACAGDFILDVDLFSREPPSVRTPPLTLGGDPTATSASTGEPR